MQPQPDGAAANEQQQMEQQQVTAYVQKNNLQGQVKDLQERMASVEEKVRLETRLEKITVRFF